MRLNLSLKRMQMVRKAIRSHYARHRAHIQRLLRTLTTRMPGEDGHDYYVLDLPGQETADLVALALRACHDRNQTELATKPDGGQSFNPRQTPPQLQRAMRQKPGPNPHKHRPHAVIKDEQRAFEQILAAIGHPLTPPPAPAAPAAPVVPTEPSELDKLLDEVFKLPSADKENPT